MNSSQKPPRSDNTPTPSDSVISPEERRKRLMETLALQAAAQQPSEELLGKQARLLKLLQSSLSRKDSTD